MVPLVSVVGRESPFLTDFGFPAALVAEARTVLAGPEATVHMAVVAAAVVVAQPEALAATVATALR